MGIKVFCYLLTLAAVFYLASCAEDTCNEKLGDTFNDLTVDSTYLDSSQYLNVNLKVNSSKHLPESYFNDCTLIESTNDPFGGSWKNSWEMIDTVLFSKNTAQIRIRPEFIPAEGKTISLHLHLSFKDRAQYIDCTHGGSSDEYNLNLDFEIKRVKGRFKTSHLTWNEKLLRGGW